MINADQFFKLGLTQFEPAEKTTAKLVNFPWINQYDLRTESRDFDLGSQEYSFRVSPSTGKIRKAQKALYEQMINAPNVDEQEIYSDVVLTLHNDWLSLFLMQKHRSVMDELVAILNDQQTIYERMVGSLDFDPQKLVKLQTDKSDIKIALNKLNLEQSFLLDKYGLQSQFLDFGDFITIQAIFKRLNNNLISKFDGDDLIDLETEYKKELLLKEMELESAEQKQLFDFVQVKYTGPHSDEWQEKVSVGLAFRLSNSGSDKLKMQELQIKQEELMRKSAWDKQEKKTKLNNLASKLQRDIQTYIDFQKIIAEERIQLNNLSQKIAEKEGTSPIFLLEIAERNLLMTRKALDKKEDLLRDYLKYLHAYGKMSPLNFVNYLKS